MAGDRKAYSFSLASQHQKQAFGNRYTIWHQMLVKRLSQERVTDLGRIWPRHRVLDRVRLGTRRWCWGKIDLLSWWRKCVCRRPWHGEAWSNRRARRQTWAFTYTCLFFFVPQQRLVDGTEPCISAFPWAAEGSCDLGQWFVDWLLYMANLEAMTIPFGPILIVLGQHHCRIQMNNSGRSRGGTIPENLEQGHIRLMTRNPCQL
jgi:hypothetical protein